MTADDCKSYLLYLNNAIQFNNQYNNAYHYSINKKPIDADYSALTKKIETNHKAPRVKINCRVRIDKHKNTLSKGQTVNWSREIFAIDSILKTNFWSYKIKDFNREKNNRKFL